jgi:hypothetical protein
MNSNPEEKGLSTPNSSASVGATEYGEEAL